MNRSEIEASVPILHAVARADGAVSDEEKVAIQVLAAQAGVSASAAPPRIDLDAEITRLESPEAKRLTLRAALAVASVDDRCAEEEHRLLEKLHAALAKGGSPLAALEARWADRMAETRRQQDAATDDFLRAIARAQRDGELSAQSYEAYVHRLEQTKRQVVGRLLVSEFPGHRAIP